MKIHRQQLVKEQWNRTFEKQINHRCICWTWKV